MSASRRRVHFNASAKSWTAPVDGASAQQVESFHQSLPGYEKTKLLRLDALAQELGVRAVYLKDESSRFTMPSFKILGASWATFRALCRKLGLGDDTDLTLLKQALKSDPFTLFAATDGNHGRAVARMGAILAIPVKIHVPSTMHRATIDLIKGEGATVIVSTGGYDDAVSEAYQASLQQGGIFVQDFAFEGYEEIPKVSLNTVNRALLVDYLCR
jgi:diaminopropionate ammonia-lyase family